MIVPLLAVTAFATSLLLVGEARDLPLLRAVSKTAASASCLGLAWVSGAAGATGVGLLAALALSLVGDVALLSRDRRAFLAGLAAFLLAHLAYLGTFVMLGVSPWRAALACVPLAAFVVAVRAWLSPVVTGGLRGPVTAYVGVICAMTATATGASVGPWPAVLLPVAAVVFVFSDLCVARERFHGRAFVNKLLGLPTYFAAQVAFATLVPRIHP